MSIRAEPRFTRDVDLAVAVVDDDDAEAAVLGLVRRGWGAVTSVEHKATGRLATVRLRPPSELVSGVLVDLLFASSGIEHDIVAASEPVEVLPGVVVPVASLAHLVAMKTLCRDDRQRPFDYDDLRHLLALASAEDLDLARTALIRIEEAGYARGRDLQASLDELLDSLRV